MDPNKKHSILRKGSINIFGSSLTNIGKKVEDEFESLMDEMGIKEEQKDIMRKMSIDKKEQLLSSKKNLKKQEKKQRSRNRSLTPEGYANMLITAMEPIVDPNILVGLRICLTTSPLEWVEKFVSDKGVEGLSNYLDILNNSPTTVNEIADQEQEILRCLRAVINTKSGAKRAYSFNQLYIVLCQSIDSKYTESRHLSSELLTFACYYNTTENYDKLVNGFQSLWRNRKTKHAFDPWILKLEESATKVVQEHTQGSIEESSELEECILSNFILINALVSTNPSLTMRVACRDELEKSGINRIIDNVSGLDNSLLEYQIEKYESEGLADAIEIENEYTNYVVNEIKSVGQAANAILDRIQGDSDRRDLLRIFKDILLVTPNKWETKNPLKKIQNVSRKLLVDSETESKSSTPEYDSTKTSISSIDRYKKYKTSRLSDRFDREQEIEMLEAAIEEAKEAKQKLKEALNENSILLSEVNSKSDGLVGSLRKKTMALEDLLRISRHTIGSLQSQIEENKQKNESRINSQQLLIQELYDLLAEDLEEKRRAMMDKRDYEEQIKVLRQPNIRNPDGSINEELLAKDVKRLRSQRYREKENTAFDKTEGLLSKVERYEPKIIKRRTINVAEVEKIGDFRTPQNPLNEKMETIKDAKKRISRSPKLNRKTFVLQNTNSLPPQNPAYYKTNKKSQQLTIETAPRYGKKFLDGSINLYSPQNNYNPSIHNIDTISAEKKALEPTSGLEFDKLPLSANEIKKSESITSTDGFVKLKQMHWDKMGYQDIKGSLWEYLDKMDIKEDEFEEKMASNEVFKMIDTMAHNINIVLGQMKKYSTSTIRKNIVEIDDSMLTSFVLSQLRACVPTPEEKAMLLGYKDRADELANADRFMIEMMKINRIEQRLKCLEFRSLWRSIFKDCSEDIDNVIKASESLLNCKEFMELLQIILIIGNYMNGSGFRGGAFGFKINSLNKVIDTKDIYNKSTLLHFIVNTIENVFPKALSFKESLEPLSNGCKVSYNDLRAEVNNIKNQILMLKKEVETCEDIIASEIDIEDEYTDDDYESLSSNSNTSSLGIGVNNDNTNKNGETNESNKTSLSKEHRDKNEKNHDLKVFVQVVKPEIRTIESRYNLMVDEFEHMKQLYEKVARKFGENPQKTNPEDLFARIEQRRKNRLNNFGEKGLIQNELSDTKHEPKVELDNKEKGAMDSLLSSLRNTNTTTSPNIEDNFEPKKMEKRDSIRKSVMKNEVRCSTMIGAQALDMLRAIREENEADDEGISPTIENQEFNRPFSIIKRKKRQIRKSFFRQ
ncbi:hypothetical protein BB558_005117 [Smittium angustum]|uniref:FH2 domain-containing protein n=1 Tax=Smittium angustum TaxID=133377 RepID=A0A2U1J1D9_SMIAN|nr:hypothetical protein BB558_005117 [Smittium angustum]